jgi:hypothetical protein
MNFSIHQTLHGYKEGHQLLASSTDLDVEVRKILLFQSDLSGSNVVKGFETYLSGYPIPNSKYYALSMTWYAAEMPRPGCVWTQTLLIEIVDLGKMPELAALLTLFIRPEVNRYQMYQEKIVWDLNITTPDASYNTDLFNSLATRLYNYPEKAILLRSEFPQKYINEVLNIWSDQWPRLRRSFCFCTGSLGIKYLNGREFDLQIIPRNLNTKQLDNTRFLAIEEGSVVSLPDWLHIIHDTSRNDLRRFLWFFGADIAGTRKNYTVILRLYQKYRDLQSIDQLGDSVREFLPSPSEGKSLKNYIFDNAENNKFAEIDILRYLVTESNIEFLNVEQYRVSERIVKLVNDGNISFQSFVELWNQAKEGRISVFVWDSIEYGDKAAIEILESNHHLVDRIVGKRPEICTMTETWSTSLQIQKLILNNVRERFPLAMPYEIIVKMLESRSLIIIDVINLYGESAVSSILNWYAGTNYSIPIEITRKILLDCSPYFLNWITPRLDNLPPKILVLLFTHLNNNQLLILPFSTTQWITVFESIRQTEATYLPRVSCVVLAIGFKNYLTHSELLVATAFAHVFQFAAESRLDEIWNVIPQDLEGFEEQEDFNMFESFVRLFGINPAKKRFQIPYWDHCELLIITYTHAFIKKNWSLQSFLNGLSSSKSFNRAVAYCITFKKGQEYLEKLKKHAVNGRLNARPFQLEILKKYNRDF